MRNGFQPPSHFLRLIAHERIYNRVLSWLVPYDFLLVKAIKKTLDKKDLNSCK